MNCFHTRISRHFHRNLAGMLGALAASALLISTHAAQGANTPSETYRCLESSKSNFSVGVALTQGDQLTADSFGAVTLIRPENEESEANFTIQAIRRKKDRLELDLRPIGEIAEATGLKSLRIRPSGRAESEAETGGGPVTLSCTRQFLK